VGDVCSIVTDYLEAKKVVRSLLLLTENLAALPAERFIVMKAYYTADCPPSYTPQHFVDALDPQTESDDSDVDATKIGDIETAYHKFSMRCV
jgi:hypothetical protein